VVAAERKIYGFGETVSTPDSPTQNHVYSYDPSRNTWATVTSAPENYDDTGTATLGHDGDIYVLEGSEMDAFDPRTKTWRTPAPPFYPAYYSAATTGLDGRIYLLGGAVTSDLQIYDPRTNMWTVGASMPVARGALAAVAGSDGYIYAIGGTAQNLNGYVVAHPLGLVERYSPKTNQWTSVASLRTPRYGLSAVMAPDGKIYAIGGIGGIGKIGFSAAVETYAVARTTASSSGARLLHPVPGKLPTGSSAATAQARMTGAGVPRHA
jgi:N-acetylneuraminic acid mutarotase